MNRPIVLSGLILLGGGVIGWHDYQRLSEARAKHDRTMEDAAERGVSVYSSGGSASSRVPIRAREDPEAATLLLASDYVRFVKRRYASRNQHDENEEALEREVLDFKARLKALNSKQWEILLTTVCSDTELKDSSLQALLYNLISLYADRHPQEALAFLANHDDLIKESRAEHLISTSLVSWSRYEPLAAMEWVLENNASYPDFVSEDTKRGMITAAAVKDPQTAFSLLRGLEVENITVTMGDLITTANTPEEQTETLLALRGYLAGIDDEESRRTTSTIAMMAIARSVVLDGFQAASQWTVSAGLTPEELRQFSIGLQVSVGREGASTLNESGKWVEWIGANLPAEKTKESIRPLLETWTRVDVQAAAEWLNSLPEDAVRNISVRAFAETVAPLEPDSATQWALTLPPGKDRDETLKNIHTNWPRDDPQGAAEFADEHGISE